MNYSLNTFDLKPSLHIGLEQKVSECRAICCPDMFRYSVRTYSDLLSECRRFLQEEYLSWQSEDKKTLKRINQLLQDIMRNGNQGIGKPERLRGDLSEYWSRRIDEKNRIVYRILTESIEVVQCKTHYEDK